MSKNAKRLVCLTGGGTAGHVMPHLALLPLMKARNWELMYVGSAGIEKQLILDAGITFKQIMTGKLRRYFSVQNFFDLFKVAIGALQAFFIFLFNRPSVVFSKGGFVSVPVAFAAWALGIPVVSHESDITPGLANKIITPLAKKILFTFPDTEKYIPASKSQFTGTPVRTELFEGDRKQGLKLCNFDDDSRPTILVMGGSQGAENVNNALKEALDQIVEKYRIIHITGKGKGLELSTGEHEGLYKGFEYVSDDLKHLFAAADLVISRSGANSIFEFLALKKPMLLIPLEQGSRGDQVLNAIAFTEKGWAITLKESDITPENLKKHIDALGQHSQEIKTSQEKYDGHEAAETILTIIESV